jgi:hypothetical protein
MRLVSGSFDCGRLLTPSLEHDCLERDTCRIGAEFARYSFGKLLNGRLFMSVEMLIGRGRA